MRIFILLILLNVFFIVPVKVSAQINTQDSLALVDLYNSTNGAYWPKHSNWLTAAPVSTWYGITLSSDRVIKIDLSSDNLKGAIPSSIGNLSALQDLSFFNNQLSGKIPSALANLTNLQTLYLNRNYLSDSIPSFLGDLINLRLLFLDTNQFTGIIPSSLGNLQNLQYLVMYYNKLSGSIPASLGNLHNLQQLYLNYNQLTGEIPSSLGDLTSVQSFQLDHNQLTGEIPSSIGNLINLQSLVLSYNQLTGEIPASFGNLINLISVELCNNQLTGEIPASLGNWHNVKYLSLSNNHLSGSIPSSFGNISKLQYCYLNNNLLTGSIPSCLGGLTMLGELYLDNNYLSDSIPACLTNLSGLYYFTLSNNKFTFKGMEQLAQKFSSIPKFTYSYQAKPSLNYNGNKLSTSPGGTLANDTFYWYRNNALYATKVGDSTLTITETGEYSVSVTNSIATKLILNSDTVNTITLPVEFISFTATKDKTFALLNWQTASEFNSKYYNVQRSIDGVNFNVIDRVDASGNSSNVKAYTYTDAVGSLNTNSVYYRIQEIDNDGKATLSNIQKIDLSRSIISFSVFPNPAKDFINITSPYNINNAQIRIMDMSGKILYTGFQNLLAAQQLKIPLYNIAKGVLILTVDGNDVHEQFKLMKE